MVFTGGRSATARPSSRTTERRLDDPREARKKKRVEGGECPFVSTRVARESTARDAPSTSTRL
jgi:hypothetical protein